MPTKQVLKTATVLNRRQLDNATLAENLRFPGLRYQFALRCRVPADEERQTRRRQLHVTGGHQRHTTHLKSQIKKTPPCSSFRILRE